MNCTYPKCDCAIAVDGATGPLPATMCPREADPKDASLRNLASRLAAFSDYELKLINTGVRLVCPSQYEEWRALVREIEAERAKRRGVQPRKVS